MLRVADYLDEAVGHKEAADEKDVFARSAFNRYYYASFLIVRQCLISLDEEKWGGAKHGEVPEIMRKVRKTIVQAQTRAKRQAALGGDEGKLVDQGAKAASALSDLMETAYAVRCIADYEPEVTVQMRYEDYVLKGVTNRDARRWVAKANGFSDSIERAWRTLAL